MPQHDPDVESDDDVVKQRIITEFMGLAETQKVTALLSLSSNLTIVVRDIYCTQDTLDLKIQAQSMFAISEVHEKIVPNVLSRLNGSKDRYPDSTLLEIIFEIMKNFYLTGYFVNSWDRALSYVRRRERAEKHAAS